jgi:hypothetical protein
MRSKAHASFRVHKKTASRFELSENIPARRRHDCWPLPWDFGTSHGFEETLHCFSVQMKRTASGPIATDPACPLHVGNWGKTGLVVLAPRFTGFDPIRTLAGQLGQQP